MNLGINSSEGTLCAALVAEFKVQKAPLPCPALSSALQNGLVLSQGEVKRPSMLGRNWD